MRPAPAPAEHVGPAALEARSSLPGAPNQLDGTGPPGRVAGADRQGWGALCAGEESEDDLGASLDAAYTDVASSAPGAALRALPGHCVESAPDLPAGGMGTLAIGVTPPVCTRTPATGGHRDAAPADTHVINITPGLASDGHACSFAASPVVLSAAGHGRPSDPLPCEPRSPVRAQAASCQRCGEKNPCTTPNLPPAAGSRGRLAQAEGRGASQDKVTPDSGTRKTAVRGHRAVSGGDGQCALGSGSGLGSELAAVRSQVVMAQFAAAAAEAELAGAQRVRDHLAGRVAALTAQRTRCACKLLATHAQRTCLAANQ